MKIHSITHVDYETLGSMEGWFVAQGHQLTQTRLFLNEPLPDPGTIDALVVMGGPMGVYDEAQYPWLSAEKRFIEQLLARDIPLLGVCLGAQLIAQVLGAAVSANPQREIGWFPVELTEAGQRAPLLAGLPERFTPLHWHGDLFSIPRGAQNAAASAACAHQIFTYADKVLGLQFHLETLPSLAQAFCEHDRALLNPDHFVQSAELIVSQAQHFAQNYALMSTLMQNWTQSGAA